MSFFQNLNFIVSIFISYCHIFWDGGYTRILLNLVVCSNFQGSRLRLFYLPARMMQIMGDVFEFAYCLLCVAVVLLTPFAVELKRKITLKNRYTLARRIMLATGPLALISTCLAAYVIYLNSETGECLTASSSTPGPKSDNNKMVRKKAVLICVPMSARLMVIASYLTFLMTIVVTPASWKRISLVKTFSYCCAPLQASLGSLLFCFLQAFWICGVDAVDRIQFGINRLFGQSDSYMSLVCTMLFISWICASHETYYEGVRTRAEKNFKRKRDGLVTGMERLLVMRNEMNKEMEKDCQSLKQCFFFWKNNQGPPPPVVVGHGEEQV